MYFAIYVALSYSAGDELVVLPTKVQYYDVFFHVFFLI